MNSAESSFPTQSSIPLAYYQQGYGNKLRNELDLLALAQQPDLANQLNALAFAQNPQALLSLNGLQQSESPERLLMSLQSRNRQNDPMAGLIAMTQQPSNDPYAGRYQTSPMTNQMYKSNQDLAAQVQKMSMNQGNNQLNSIMQLLEGSNSQLLNQQSLNELLLLQQQMNNKNIRNTSNVQGYPYYMNFQNPNSLNGLLPNQSLYASQNQLYYPQGPEIIDLESLTKRQLESQQLAFAKNTPENSLSALMTPEYEHLLKGLKQPAKNMEEIKFFSNESMTSPSPQHSQHLYQQKQHQQQAKAQHHALQKQQQQLHQQQKQQQQQQHQLQQFQQQLQQQQHQHQQQMVINQQKQLQSLQTPPPKEVKTAIHSQVATPKSQVQEMPPQIVQIPVQVQEKQVEKPEKIEKIEKPQVQQAPVQQIHVQQVQPQPQVQVQVQSQPQVSKPKPAPIEITVIDENDEPTQASPKETKEPQSAGMMIESSAVETKESSTASGGESQIETNIKKNAPVPIPLPIVTPVIVPVNPAPLIAPITTTVPFSNIPITITTPVLTIPAPVNVLVPPTNPNANKCFNRLCQTDVNNELLWSKQKLNNNVICRNCLNSYNKGNFCYFCQQIYPDEETTTASNDDKEWIECESCKTWNHIDCETVHGLRELPSLLLRDRDYKYYCPNCKGNRILPPRSPKATGKNSAKNSHSKPSSPSAITLESETQSIKNTTILHPRPPLDDSLMADDGLKEPIVKKLKVLDPIRTPIIEPQARVLDSEDIDRGNFAKKKLDNMFNRSSFNKKRFSNKVYIPPLESGFYIEKLLGQFGGKKLQLSDTEIRGDLELFRDLCGLREPREEENNKGGFHVNPASLNKERGINQSGRGRGAGRGRKSAFSSRPRANDDDLRDGGSDVNEGSENMGFYESSTRSIRNKKKFD